MSVFFLAALLLVAVMIQTAAGTPAPLPSKEGARTERNYIPLRKFYKFLLGPNDTIPIMPNDILTPTTTPYENPTVKLTPENVQNIVNAISNYRADQRADYKAQNPNAFQIKPNMISGYGTKPLDYDFSYYNENDLPIPQGYDTIYGKFEDEGVSGWLDQKVQSARDEDLVRRAFNVLQAQNDFDRQQRLDNFAANMRQENLYGDTLAQMLADRQAQAPAALTSSWAKPAARSRNITGRPSFEEGGAWIPADGELW